ncbi:hypothetical protein R6Z02_00080 [Carnobacterium maltaromaticum]|uniref:hypothetical protein n=1 Tax=Carnobacterium maltaromaticum TaxID=2751 RepID=UPI00298B774F|nr:hypothetical protein [Carnobacterium maltaromaticum]MDW5522128.1 hypothetical protein [Carnobacterium maltaromaticum]
MIIINELNKLTVTDFSISGEELEYVLVDDTPENRKKIDLALATQYSWCIISMTDKHRLTTGGNEILSKCSAEGYINLCQILTDELGLEVGWSKSGGFELMDKVEGEE